MGDADSYKRQIKQMVNFILQEAKCVPQARAPSAKRLTPLVQGKGQ